MTSGHRRRQARAFKLDHCEGCFRDYGRLEIHHIDEDHTNNDPDNLVTLCRSCHAKVHDLGRTENYRRNSTGQFRI